jgi:hypothetical protein
MNPVYHRCILGEIRAAAFMVCLRTTGGDRPTVVVSLPLTRLVALAVLFRLVVGLVGEDGVDDGSYLAPGVIESGSGTGGLSNMTALDPHPLLMDRSLDARAYCPGLSSRPTRWLDAGTEKCCSRLRQLLLLCWHPRASSICCLSGR